MARRDRFHDAARFNRLGDLPPRPVADRAVGKGRRLARQGDDLAHLLRRDRGGRPRPGRITSRLATGTSLRLAPENANHRARQHRAVTTLIDNARAICSLLAPSAACNTIRARKARCCGVVWPRTTTSSAERSASDKIIASGWGPRIQSLLKVGMESRHYTIKTFMPQRTSGSVVTDVAIKVGISG
jgi:hypothetical protein